MVFYSISMHYIVFHYRYNHFRNPINIRMEFNARIISMHCFGANQNVTSANWISNLSNNVFILICEIHSENSYKRKWETFVEPALSNVHFIVWMHEHGGSSAHIIISVNCRFACCCSTIADTTELPFNGNSAELIGIWIPNQGDWATWHMCEQKLEMKDDADTSRRENNWLMGKNTWGKENQREWRRNMYDFIYDISSGHCSSPPEWAPFIFTSYSLWKISHLLFRTVICSLVASFGLDSLFQLENSGTFGIFTSITLEYDGEKDFPIHS